MRPAILRPFTILAFLVIGFGARAAEDRPTVIIVTGADGSAEYADVFKKSADRWADAANRAAARVVHIGRDTPDTDPTDKQRLQKILEQESAEKSQPLWLVLIGHGTYDGRDAKVNLRGPDVSDQELAAWLLPITRPVAVVDCTSGSAPFLNRLSAKGRVVVVATRSGQEVNYSRFGDYLSQSIADPAADLDKDGQTSLLEAFLAASHRVDEFYKSAGRLATEHALLDDNGDAKGIPADWFQGVRATSKAKDANVALDGARAHQWHLLPSPAERSLTPELRAKRDELELKIEALRGRKATLREEDYYRQLDDLLVALARVYPPAASSPGGTKP